MFVTKGAVGLCSEVGKFNEVSERHHSEIYTSVGYMDFLDKIPSEEVRKIVDDFLDEQILDLSGNEIADFTHRLIVILGGHSQAKRDWQRDVRELGSYEFQFSERCAKSASDLRRGNNLGQIGEDSDCKVQNALCLALRDLSGRLAQIAPENLRVKV